MVEVQQEEEKKARALLIGAPNKGKGSRPDAKPEELEGLVKTLGMETAGIIVLNRIEPTPAYGIGTGKTKEIAAKAKELFADCIIFDWEIDPTKQRNWEKLCSIPVFDRNEVILRIFASRAQTKEAVLQVELARLTYSLPRLSHMYGDLARQRGGSYGSKGSGETQLELDRRQTEDKIVQIKKELEQVTQTRRTQRKQRERNSFRNCALVGYTNAGKSSLLNALTGADVFVENKLFATLDPTTRKFSLGEGSTILLTDTVGFISNLPHTLINAFRSTLEEASFADLLLIVVDASDPECRKQYEQVIKVLGEIGADKIPRLVLLNKWDAVKSYCPGKKTGMGSIESAAEDGGGLLADEADGFANGGLLAEEADGFANGGLSAKENDASANGDQLAEQNDSFANNANSAQLAEQNASSANSSPSAEKSDGFANSGLLAEAPATSANTAQLAEKNASSANTAVQLAKQSGSFANTTQLAQAPDSSANSSLSAQAPATSANTAQLAEETDGFASSSPSAQAPDAFANTAQLAEQSNSYAPPEQSDTSANTSALIASLNAAFPGSVKISAKTKEGFTELSQKITENLLGSLKSYLIPMDKANLVELARKNGTILKEEWLEDGIHLEARIPGIIEENGNATTRTMALLNPYAV
ncbi:MAG: GTPase HflX [Treponema sp.]|nr:GTPase HflX [Treponema sp.]